jgi:hypothetical protein
MQQNLKVLRIFIASPSDLEPERRALRAAIDDLNDVFGKETDLRIELLGWEDTMPGMGRPQSLINVDVDKADLFIGCLWKKLGSPAGIDQKTGFQEEFERAVDRFKKTGTPEIWLFFKNLSPDLLTDPGEQLQKVIEFHTKAIADKAYLFGTFSTVDDWRSQLNKHINRHALKLLQLPAPSPSAIQPTEIPATAPKAPLTTTGSRQESKALIQLVPLLRKVAAQLDNRTFAEPITSETSVDTIRISLFAAASYNWNVNTTDWGAHEINSVYLHRKELTPTNGERDFLVKVCTFDSTFTKPGWYWVGERISVINLFISLSQDNDVTTRFTAISVATFVRVSLLRAGNGELIQRLLSDDDKGVRAIAVVHVGAFGRKTDVPLVTSLTNDSDPDVRARAHEASQMILTRVNPTKELERVIISGETVTDGMMVEVESTQNKISENLLLRAFESTDLRLRVFAVRTLQSRKKLSEELLTKALADVSSLVKEQAWIALLHNRKRIDPRDIRKALPTASLLSITSDASDRPSVDGIVKKAVEILPREQLWDLVRRFDQDSKHALKRIGDMATQDDLQQIRASLDRGFKPQVERRELGRGSFLSDLFDPLNYVDHESDLRAVALGILADAGNVADRGLYLDTLSNKSSTPTEIVAALRGIGRVGQPNDAKIVATLLKDSGTIDVRAAARSFLKLSTNFTDAVGELMLAPSEPKILACIEIGAEKSIDPFPLLKGFLTHGENEVRRCVALYAALRATSRAALQRIMGSYLNGRPLYYDVVFIFDLVIYAPRKIRDFRINEMFGNDSGILEVLRELDRKKRGPKMVKRRGA